MKMYAHVIWIRRVQALAPVALVVLFGTLIAPGDSSARQNMVTGSMSVGSDYNSNIYKSDDDRRGQWTSHLVPQFTITSKGLTDTLAVTYAPDFGYNFRREDDETVHSVSLLADKGLSSRWKVKLSGNYVNSDTMRFETDQNLSVVQNYFRADAPTQADIVRILFPELAWDPTIQMGYVVSEFQKRYDAASPAARGEVDGLLFNGSDRQKYWTSTMDFVSEYEFAEKSLISLGYRVLTQDSKSGSLTGHVEQTPSIMVAYQFNTQWRGVVGYDFTFNTYDTSDDSTTNRPHLQVDYEISPRDLVFWNYAYQQISFDGESGGTTEQSSGLGWKHDLNQQTALTTALGTTYSNRALGADEREYSLDLAVSRTIEKGAIAVTGNVVSAEDEHAGSWDKSRRSWEIGSDLSYRLMQDLSATGRVSYGQWRSWSMGTQSSYDQFDLGGGVSYGLNRWVTLSLNYDYSVFDTTEALLDDYSEHLISIRLSAAKELWRW